MSEHRSHFCRLAFLKEVVLCCIVFLNRLLSARLKVYQNENRCQVERRSSCFSPYFLHNRRSNGCFLGRTIPLSIYPMSGAFSFFSLSPSKERNIAYLMPAATSVPASYSCLPRSHDDALGSLVSSRVSVKERGRSPPPSLGCFRISSLTTASSWCPLSCVPTCEERHR